MTYADQGLAPKRVRHIESRVARLRDYASIDWRLQQELEGVPLEEPDEIDRLPLRSGTARPYGPVRSWLWSQIVGAAWAQGIAMDEGIVVDAMSGPQWVSDDIRNSAWFQESFGRVARTLRISSRRLHEYLYERDDTVVEGAVDRMASRHGGVMAWEILSFSPARRERFGYVSAGVWGTKRTPRRRGRTGGICHSPKCDREAVPDGRFCEECSARLRKVADELAADAKRIKARVGRANARPTCCFPGCGEARLRSRKYCDEHEWTMEEESEE